MVETMTKAKAVDMEEVLVVGILVGWKELLGQWFGADGGVF